MINDDDDGDDTTAATRNAMWSLHPIERLSALTLTCLMCNKANTRASIKGLLAIASAMARMHGATMRGALANDLRDIADTIERPLQ